MHPKSGILLKFTRLARKLRIPGEFGVNAESQKCQCMRSHLLSMVLAPVYAEKSAMEGVRSLHMIPRDHNAPTLDPKFLASRWSVELAKNKSYGWVVLKDDTSDCLRPL